MTLPIVAAEPSKEQVDFFENKVRPLLAEHCYSCHSDAKNKRKGGLAVDSRAALLTGGDSGPSIVPGKPKDSPLIAAVQYTGDTQMPPKGKLKDDEIAILVKWVEQGAVWPGEAKAGSKRKPGTITEEDRQWWSFQPMKPHAVPSAGESWARNEIDRFIAAKQISAKLSPAPEASKRVLIRRLTFDLHGLPPTPEEVNAFESDASPDAYEKLVARLLDSPRYGERQARLWLDLVRYADSDGYRIDDYRPHAWRYRDYVIRSFNADKGYDRFVQEQLAGDEMFPENVEARIATGYLRHGIYEYNNRDARGQWTTILNDITDTTSDVFLGLGLQCARCHDHKFDPLLQKDYYRLQAFFAGHRPLDQVAATPEQVQAYQEKLKIWEEKTAHIHSEIAKLEAPYREKAAQGAIDKFPDDVQAMMKKLPHERTPYEQQVHELAYRQVDYEFDRLEKNIKGADKDKYLALKRELLAFDSIKPAPLPLALSATEIGPVAPPITIPKKNDAILPGVPTILDPEPMNIPGSGRRTALAKWLTQPLNPLTARVMVNRLWQQHFGRGLAVVTSDFGKLGEAPTHPELLDWLALRFVQEGWSLKSLHRLIVTSATYRQSARHPDPATGRLTDPENKLLWKAPVRRLEAEQIRDALFMATGELNLKDGGPGVAGSEPRRSVYCKTMRNSRDALLDVFDAPYAFTSASSRDTTTTPVQSLLLINSPTMIARAKAFAARIERSAASDSERVAQAYQLAFGRMPTAEESTLALRFIDAQTKRVDPQSSSSPQAAFVAAKIPYRDGQAADIKMGEGGYQLPGLQTSGA